MSTLPTRPPQGQGFASSMGSLWRDPATSQKLMALGLLVASLAVGAYGVRLLLQGSEEALYRNLPEQEAASTVDKLRGASIEARLGEDGRSVWVRSSQLEPARLTLANEGFPMSGSLGYELFDNGGPIAMTDFLEQVTLRRALEGELQRTIASLDEVSAARVHLVLPEKAAFLSEEQPAKASVQLRLTRPITPNNARTIVKLVAAAVPNLEPSGVVLVDSQGRDLYAGDEQTEGGLTTDQLARKEHEEKLMVERATALVGGIVGQDRVKVSATVAMDFTSSQERLETVDPNQIAVIGEQQERRFDPNDSSLARGIPGTRSNPAPESVDPTAAQDPAVQDPAVQDPAAPDPADGAAPQDADAAAGPVDVTPAEPRLTYEKTTMNRQVSTRVIDTVIPAGRVTRRSIAVVVDNAAPAEDGTPAPARTPDELEQFRETLVAGLGLQLDAGDSISVQNIPFVATPAADPFPEPSLLEQVQPFLGPAWRNLSWILFLMVFYFVLFKPVLKKISEPVQQVQTEVGMLPEVAGMGSSESPEASAMMAGMRQSGVQGPALLQEAQQVSLQTPEVASELVRGWLSEDAS